MRCRATSDRVGVPTPVAAATAARATLLPATSDVAPASGANAVQPSIFLLDRSPMSETPKCFVSRSRHLYVVALCHDVPQRHHCVILVHHVVTVDRVLTRPVAEFEEQHRALVRMQLRDVLPAEIGRYAGCHAVAAENLVFLQVNVHGVRPVAGEVGEDPLLGAVLLDREAELGAIHELPVDRPLAVQAIELEGAHNPRW